MPRSWSAARTVSAPSGFTSAQDHGWTVEIAYPWQAFQSRQEVPQSQAGTVWRCNFSRVESKAGQPREDNWVWSPQGVINMHVPEQWGYLHFRDSKESDAK